ncbi:uncharacterized protein LOC125946108 isoform X2 [Dermacentor silvarum]|nr:uncharacterized protein LOC125946108 isoform X2 [Dermacentor silvarum]
MSQRKIDPPLSLPCYFLNEDILTVEAQLRFKRTIDEVMDILCKVREIISEMCNHQMDYRDIDNYLRGNHAKSSLITSHFADVHESPGPTIVWSTSTKAIFCAEDELVSLKDDCMLEKALLLCLTVYYVKDITYPSAFAQTLGLVQSVLCKEESFPRCWANSKLLKILDKLNSIL